LREPTNNIKLIPNLTLMAPALKILSMAVKLMISLYTRYWPNLVINALAAPVSIIILYHLLELYQEVSLEVVKYAKRKVDLLRTTPVSIY
jgi:hypothetical protein